MKRPLIKLDIHRLRRLLEKNRDEPEILGILLEELQQRSSPPARALALEIQQLLDGGRSPRTRDETRTPQERDPRRENGQPASHGQVQPTAPPPTPGIRCKAEGCSEHTTFPPGCDPERASLGWCTHCFRAKQRADQAQGRRTGTRWWE